MPGTKRTRTRRDIDLEDPSTWGTKSRWVFTLNNYTDEEVAQVATWDTVYHHYGKETAPTTGTPHLQGYAIFKDPCRLAALMKLCPRARWFPAIGTTEDNIVYCSKENLTQFGTPPKPKGKAEQQRWEDARTAAREGRLDDVPADIYLRYYRTLKEIRKDHMVTPPDADGVTGVWYWGPPESGKSRTARATYPDAYLKGQHKWWDGYQDQPYVLLDDLDTGVLGHYLKIWADRYAFTAETKGGAICIRPAKIVITSNYAPEDPRFGWDGPMVAAIRRRFTVVYVPKEDEP